MLRSVFPIIEIIVGVQAHIGICAANFPNYFGEVGQNDGFDVSMKIASVDAQFLG